MDTGYFRCERPGCKVHLYAQEVVDPEFRAAVEAHEAVHKGALREFIEARLLGYMAGLTNLPNPTDAFPDQALNYATLKVREDCLRRLLQDFDRAVASGEVAV